MARRDNRNRNNRAKITKQTQVTRPVTKTQTRDVTYQEKGSTVGYFDSRNSVAGQAAYDYRQNNPGADNLIFGYDPSAGHPSDAIQKDNIIGTGEFNKAKDTWEYYDNSGNQMYLDGGGPDSTGSKFSKYVDKTRTDSYTTTDYKTETRSSSRMQALDKRSSDDDAQKQRQLKTKREGRSKLRIQASGDSSAGRLKGGPNSGRQRNKLNIDVQGAGGGGTGLNVPR